MSAFIVPAATTTPVTPTRIAGIPVARSDPTSSVKVLLTRARPLKKRLKFTRLLYAVAASTPTMGSLRQLIKGVKQRLQKARSS